MKFPHSAHARYATSTEPSQATILSEQLLQQVRHNVQSITHSFHSKFCSAIIWSAVHFSFALHSNSQLDTSNLHCKSLQFSCSLHRIVEAGEDGQEQDSCCGRHRLPWQTRCQGQRQGGPSHLRFGAPVVRPRQEGARY